MLTPNTQAVIVKGAAMLARPEGAPSPSAARLTVDKAWAAIHKPERPITHDGSAPMRISPRV
jgi:hypothetical protein